MSEENAKERIHQLENEKHQAGKLTTQEQQRNKALETRNKSVNAEIVRQETKLDAMNVELKNLEKTTGSKTATFSREEFGERKARTGAFHVTTEATYRASKSKTGFGFRCEEKETDSGTEHGNRPAFGDHGWPVIPIFLPPFRQALLHRKEKTAHMP